MNEKSYKNRSYIVFKHAQKCALCNTEESLGAKIIFKKPWKIRDFRGQFHCANKYGKEFNKQKAVCC